MSSFSRWRTGGALAWPLGLVTLLGLTLVTPFLRWSSGPCTNDGHLLYHRLAAMRYAWENGVLFSRWLPDVVFGYGYPFFVFREAPPLYLALLPHLLGMPLPAAINLYFAACIMAGGIFMFLWVRDVFGTTAGLVSSVAYMVAPYFLVEAYVLGIQPEMTGLALMPLVGFAGRRFMVRGTAGAFLGIVFSLALLTLSHNISSLIFMPFLLLYLLVVGWIGRLNGRVLAVRLGLVFLLGLGLSSFYTGPALLELDEITIEQSVNNRNNDFHFNFTTVDEILAPIAARDPGLLNPPFLLRLGWAPAILALIGITSLFWNRSREQRGHIIFMALAAAVLLFMSLRLSQFLWETVPLMRFIQFPWRLVGRAALPVAFLAGAPFALWSQAPISQRRRSWTRPVFAAGAVTLLALEALPMLLPFQCPAEPFPGINQVQTYERESGLLGVDPTGSYFPLTVLSRPESSPLEADYLSGRTPRRFDSTVLPAGATVQSESYGPNSAEILVYSPQPFEGRYLSFAFPGWQVSVDGQSIPVTPSVSEGLITFPVPAGQHLVTVRWGSTPLRGLMACLSLLALVAVVVTAVALQRGESRLSWQDNGFEDYQKTLRPSNRWLFISLAIIGLGLLFFKLAIVDKRETPFRQEAPPPVANPAGLSAAELRFEGHTVNKSPVASGETLEVDLAWRAVDQTPKGQYQSNVWLVGPEGAVWSDKETYRPRTYEETSPTTFWLPGQWAWDSREVAVLPGTPPGFYKLVLTLFDLADLQPLTLLGPDGAVLGPEVVIGQVEVTRPETLSDFTPNYPLDAELAGLQLLGYNQDRLEAAPGQPLLLTFFWEKPAGYHSGEGQLTLRLLDEAGAEVHSWSITPGPEGYRPEQWQAGERIRSQHALRLPAGLKSGDYILVLENLPLGSLAVQAPDRLFEEPAYESAAQADFAGLAELRGYTLAYDLPDPETQILAAQTPITLTLIWQSLEETPTGYRVFVHLVDENGQILAQSDAEPAGWQRPTSGWTRGEYIVDLHRLVVPQDVPSGSLTLGVGLYDAATGDRLTTDGGDFAVLEFVRSGGP